MLRSLVGSEMCIRDSINAEYGDRSRVTMAGSDGFPEHVIDTHVHLSHHYSGGLKNAWLPDMPESFQRNFTTDHLAAAIQAGSCPVSQVIFIECFNIPAVEEARWILDMVNDPNCMVAGLVAQIQPQDGAVAVTHFLEQLRMPDGSLPPGLKGGRMVFPARENNAPDACLDPNFIEGLQALQAAGLHWEFCVNPFSAPFLPRCVAQLPGLTFVIDHLAHNGNDGGDMAVWGPAMEELSKLPNVWVKLGGVEEWGVESPSLFLDRAIELFGFERVLYESNWFAMGHEYDKTAKMVLAACQRAGATAEDVAKVFHGNACTVYRL
eukprot:TRINITY_DN7017_c0_g1_i2.p1 TRINITY_DN7017_c0_g1~~TRINITY_DN7017_c0_g1_i2.p1  ORF type:complete len:322 (-),score=72.89 TRINITY_DN7017_c0_g1_i2:138-1103(-)